MTKNQKNNKIPVNEIKKDVTAETKTASIVKEAKSGIAQTWHKTKEVSKDTWEVTKENSTDVWEATKSGATKAWEKAKEVSKDTWEATKEGLSKTGEAFTEATGKAWDMAMGNEEQDNNLNTAPNKQSENKKNNKELKQ